MRKINEPRRGKHLTKSEEQRICALYESRWSVKEIASHFQCSDATIRNVLKRNGTTPPSIKLTGEEISQIVEMYGKGIPVPEIADQLRRSVTTVRDCLKNVGVHISYGGPRRQRKSIVQKPKGSTLCWKCKHSVPCPEDGIGCTWTLESNPVDGWEAIETTLQHGKTVDQSYHVISCPQFERG